MTTHRRKLTPQLVARARSLAAAGLPLVQVAEALGIHRATLHRWRTEAGPAGLERDLCDALQGAQTEAVVALLERIRADPDTRAARWLLTHAPAWRETWSDAGHTRRKVSEALSAVVAVILRAPELDDQQRHGLLLQLQAAGIAGESWQPSGEGEP